MSATSSIANSTVLCFPLFTQNSSYFQNSEVSFNGTNYVAKWWQTGEQTPEESKGWASVGTCNLTITPSCHPVFVPGQTYYNGSEISHNMTNYVARWWNEIEHPGVVGNYAWFSEGPCKFEQSNSTLTATSGAPSATPIPTKDFEWPPIVEEPTSSIVVPPTVVAPSSSTTSTVPTATTEIFVASPTTEASTFKVVPPTATTVPTTSVVAPSTHAEPTTTSSEITTTAVPTTTVAAPTTPAETTTSSETTTTTVPTTTAAEPTTPVMTTTTSSETTTTIAPHTTAAAPPTTPAVPTTTTAETTPTTPPHTTAAAPTTPAMPTTTSSETTTTTVPRLTEAVKTTAAEPTTAVFIPTTEIAPPTTAFSEPTEVITTEPSNPGGVIDDGTHQDIPFNDGDSPGSGANYVTSWHWFAGNSFDCDGSITADEYNMGFYAGAENIPGDCGKTGTFEYEGNSVTVTFAWRTTGGSLYHELSSQAFAQLIGSDLVVTPGMPSGVIQIGIDDPGRVVATCTGDGC
ncbi:hypothetical protein HDU98_001753 [Podochytrium sp. JEL0797]|nr:hypothetical protein HDU98_001753 [Podochytrium sp. JEL0797]